MRVVTARTSEKLAKQIAAAGTTLLLLDFDGTLAPLHPDPHAVQLSARMRRLLEALAKRYRVALISGRSLADIRKRVGIRGVWYAGNHGFEWFVGVKGEACIPRAEREAVRAAARAVRKLARAFPGMRLEDKGATLIVRFEHVRPKKRAEAVAAVRSALAPYGDAGLIAVREKPLDMDIRPCTDWNKGSIARLMAEQCAGALPVFIGDDDTDEDAFRSLSGVTIRVGRSRHTAARYCFASRDDVEPFLAALIRPSNS